MSLRRHSRLAKLRPMPRLSRYDAAALAATLHKQHQIIGRAQALACGLTLSALRHRIRPGGPWTVELPGVYRVGAGQLTADQRAVAAFLHAGQAIAITGQAALIKFGVPCPATDFVDVLVPPACRRADLRFVRLHRTAQQVTWSSDGVVRYVSPQRAVADAARQLADFGEVRALVAAGVQRNKVALWQLNDELRAGRSQGSARFRQALAEVAVGVRSVAEGDLRQLIRKARLPEPLYNPSLFIGSQFLASPDVWWPAHGVALEVDSRAYHLSPADSDRTVERHNKMTAAGILLLHFPPTVIRAQEWKVVRAVKLAIGRSPGPLAHIATVPAG